MKKLLIAGLVLAPIFLFSQQVAKNLTATNGTYIGFWQYTPTDYSANPTTKYPLIIFLHGIGERGDGVNNLPSVLGQGIPKNINEGHTMRFFWNGKWETFLVLSPQLSTSYGDWQNFYVEEMIKYAKQNLRIDTDRIFLTGLSLGGGGVWRYASTSSTFANELAGIAPVCGTCNMVNPANIANAKLPVWAFHALDDGTVGSGCTTSSIQNINNNNPAVKPLMTLYASGGHYIWNRSFDTDYNYHDPNLYEWFLGQNKSLPANVLPIARAGADITISASVGTANLSGSASTDADGNIVRYIWRKISGPNVGSISSLVSTNGLSSVSGLTTVGVYQYELKVIDNRTSSSLDTVTVNVTTGGGGGNISPIARAGADVSITLPANSTSLNGSTSGDQDGTIVSYNWTKVSGPTQFTIANSTAASTTVSNLVQGTYIFRLAVNDNAGATGADDITIIVNGSGAPTNQSPIAKAGSDITIILPANSTNLNGSTSYDPDGSIQSYYWTKLSGPSQYTISNSTLASPPLSNLVSGTYQFLLTINDMQGALAKDTVQVNVTNQQTLPPPAPVALAGSDITIVLPTNSVTLIGSGSYSPAGTITSWSWVKINGPSSSAITSPQASSTTVTGLVQGTYNFSLSITDIAGGVGKDTITVFVNGSTGGTNQPPVANAGADQTISGSSTTLNGSGSNDPDGSIASYYWTKVSGPSQYTISNSTIANPSVTNLVPGVYEFNLLINDNNGVLASDIVKITVGQSSGNYGPIARAGADQTISNSSTSLDGSGSYDPDGSIASYYWTKISGPSQYTISNSTIANPVVNNLVAGVYEFKLLINDIPGVLASDTVKITVGQGGGGTGGNKSPIANAGPDQTITGSNTSLNGSSSYDPDGSIASYYWTKISGPSQYLISNSTIVSPTASNLVQGVYEFKLLINDNQGVLASDTIRITVGQATGINRSPVANAGADQSISGSSTQLNGNGSYDPDGSIGSYYWVKVSGPAQYAFSNSTISNPVAQNLVTGVYEFALLVNDAQGVLSSDTVRITVGQTAGSAKQNVSMETVTATAIEEKLITYPNPAISMITVRVSSQSTGSTSLTIYDASGKSVRSSQFVKNNPVHEVPMNISNLKTGIYYVEVVTGNQKKMVTKFLKQ